MLNKLALQCFRRHEVLVIDFTPGINVMRGANVTPIEDYNDN